MFIENDSDIKIAGDKPSRDIKKNTGAADERTVSKEQREAAKRVGAAVAEQFLKDAAELPDGENTDYNLLMQRRLLLSFSATAGFEQYIGDDVLEQLDVGFEPTYNVTIRRLPNAAEIDAVKEAALELAEKAEEAD